MKVKKLDLSFVIPFYNENQNLIYMYNEIHHFLNLNSKTIGKTKLIFVNDGSTDDSEKLLRGFLNSNKYNLDLAYEDNRGQVQVHTRKKLKFPNEKLGAERTSKVILISLKRNSGQSYSIRIGLQHSLSCQKVIIIDSDGQHNCESMNELWQHRMDSDIILTSTKSDFDSLSKKFLTKLYYYLKRKLDGDGIGENRVRGEFKLMDKTVVDRINRYPITYTPRYLVAMLPNSRCTVPIQLNPRYSGETKYGFRKMSKLAFEIFASRGILIEKIAEMLTKTWIVIVASYVFYIIHGWATNRVLPGWTSLSLLVSIGFCFLTIIGNLIISILRRLQDFEEKRSEYS